MESAVHSCRVVRVTTSLVKQANKSGEIGCLVNLRVCIVCVCLCVCVLIDRCLAKRKHWWPFKTPPTDVIRSSPDKVLLTFNVPQTYDIRLRSRSIVCASVCLSVCMSVGEDISGTTRAIFSKFLYTCCSWQWLGPSLTG